MKARSSDVAEGRAMSQELLWVGPLLGVSVALVMGARYLWERCGKERRHDRHRRLPLS